MQYGTAGITCLDGDYKLCVKVSHLKGRKMAKKQSYSLTLNVVEAGFIACWQNVRDLVASAKLLNKKGYHAPSLSLSVLALEEIGKMVLLDGMLLAIQGDYKAKHLNQSSRSHRDKLLSLDILPILIDNLSRHDPRYDTDNRYRSAVAMGMKNLQEAGNLVMSLLEDGYGFTGLDAEKQKGFYASLSQTSVIAPKDFVCKELSSAVVKFAQLADSNLNFALKDGNLDRYLSTFQKLREKISAKEHDAIKELAGRIAEDLFGLEDDQLS